VSSHHSATTRIRQLVPQEMPILADALGDSPETVISWYLLWTGSCNAWCAGDLHEPSAIIVQAHLMPDELIAFGNSADDILAVLHHVHHEQHWTSILVPTHLARELERPIADLVQTLSISTMDDIYHVLDADRAPIDIPANVRLMTPADEALLGGADAFTSNEFGETVIAAAIEEGEIVSLAHTFAWSPDHADIGVMTHEDARGKGYATATAALVIDGVRKQGKVPVWSCGARNDASLRVAGKLGFREVGRKVYIIPQIKEEPATE